MKYKFRVEIAVHENCSPFKPNITRYEFDEIAESEIEAMNMASSKVPTKGYPYDEVKVQVLYSSFVIDPEELDAATDAILADLNQGIDRELVGVLDSLEEAERIKRARAA